MSFTEMNICINIVYMIKTSEGNKMLPTLGGAY